MNFSNRTLTDLLRMCAERDPEKPALIGEDRVVSFSELDRLSDHVATALAGLGIGRGDVVSCQLPNSPEFLILHHAVAKRRAIFNPVHLPYRRSEVEHILKFSQSAMVVVGPPYHGFSFVEMGLAIQKACPTLNHVVSVGGENRQGAIPFASLLEESGTSGVESSGPRDPFLLLFTSGTTASPKGTLHTHAMRMPNSAQCARDLGFRSEDLMICCSALSHMWGIFNYWGALSVGCSQILLPKFSPEAFIKKAAQARATLLIGAPVHTHDLLASADFEPDSLSTLRTMVLSGSVCPPDLIRRLKEALPNCSPLVFWGMTETGGGFHTRPDDSDDVMAQTAGRSTAGVAFSVRDEAGEALGPGQEGELVIKSPFAITEYWKHPAATRESFTADGWFRTGDLATVDAAGNIRIRGRQKEQINRGGVKFQPEDVEKIILQHPGVHQAAMVGVPDERLGERSVCFLTIKNAEAPPSLEELTALLEANGVAKFKWPERLETVDAFPFTPTGKIRRGALRERLNAVKGSTP